LVLLWEHDRDVLRYLQVERQQRDDWVHLAARKISFWGDYLTWTVPMALAIWWGAERFGSRSWRRMALACLLAASVAGITANCFRLSLGRPRPHANLDDGFYGLQKRAMYHSFPSGHAATAFGTAVPLWFLSPPAGAAATGFAVLVGWSRMQLDKHYPTDILAGMALGITMGIAAGKTVRRQRVRA
jgi:membrane-associated phospholipid phosphatase